MKRGFLQIIVLLLILAAIPIVVFLYLHSKSLKSGAQGPAVSLEAESGALTGDAVVLKDTNASKGSYVKFGATTAQIGANYFVSPNGSDTNNGLSATSAYKTIQHALDIAKPGIVINLAPGSYHETLTTKVDGTATAPIVIHGTDIAKDPSSRHKTVLYSTSRILNVNNSYYQFDGFAIDGQEAIPLSSYPTDPSQAVTFKDANQSLVKDGRLIYVGSADTTSNLTGIKITNMFLHGAGGECLRMRNVAHDNEVSNSVIEWCGMFAKPNADRYNYHNAEGVYIGTSPKSTTQPMYANDTSNNNTVTNNIINTYGSECFNIKENAHDNKFLNNECRYNLEPLESDGSNIELRGDHNTVAGNQVTSSDGWNLKLRSDSSTYDKGGNTIQSNTFTKARGANIHTEQKDVIFCGNVIDGSVEGVASNIVTTPCTTSATPIPCAVPSSGGVVTANLSLVSSGTYRVWSRLMSTGDSANSFWLQIDSQCPVNVGDLTGMPASSWIWVDYQNGGTANKISVDLTTGSHTIRLMSKESNVAVDELIFTTDTTCVPIAIGDNCLSATPSPTPTPLASTKPVLTSPTPTPTPGSSNSVNIFEAESGVISPPMQTFSDPSASGGKYVAQTATSGTGTASYTFAVSQTGKYQLKGRVIASSGSTNSFYYSFDNLSSNTWNLPDSISSWTWADGPSVNLSAGTHSLLIKKREINTKLDQIEIKFVSLSSSPSPISAIDPTVPFEAESGTISGGIQISSDSTASGGKYIIANSKGIVTYQLNIANSGNYRIAGWVEATNGSSNSYYMKVDSGSAQVWDFIQPTVSWTYDADGNPVFYFSAGAHTLTLNYRESGAKLDRLVLIKQ